MSFVRKVYKNFMRNMVLDDEIAPDVAGWMRFLDKLPQPQDSVDVSFNRHKCRMTYFKVGLRALMNMMSLVRLLIAVPKLLKKSNSLPEVGNNDLLLLRDLRIAPTDVIPQELQEAHDNIIEEDRRDLPVGNLCQEAKQLFWACVRRHPFSFWYNLLVLKELSAHSILLQKHNVKATAVYVVESNVAYPVVTQMYENTGRKLVSFMHGEYLLQLSHAYMQFSEYYVWGKAYVDMFTNDLRCRIGQYKVYTPKKLQKKWELEKVEPEYFCTYYFSSESKEAVRKIAEVFDALQKEGKKCKVRPHPRSVKNVKDIFDAFSSVKVEIPQEVSLMESLAQTEYAVGLASTVLSEALVEGRKVAVDDISDPEQFKSLRARKAAILNKEHCLLSELCR